MHGMTMIFLYALPVLSGFSNYLWPLILGSRDMAFPRLNAFSYWIYLASGLFMYAGFAVGAAPNDGWFNYTSRMRCEPSIPGLNIDFYALGMIFLGISTTVGLDQLRRHRAAHARAGHVDQPGADPDLGHAHRLGRQSPGRCRPSVSPSSCCGWTASSARISSTSPRGGQPLLWQHLFWMFGHPWVKPTSRSAAAGVISTEPSIETALW